MDFTQIKLTNEIIKALNKIAEAINENTNAIKEKQPPSIPQMSMADIVKLCNFNRGKL